MLAAAKTGFDSYLWTLVRTLMTARPGQIAGSGMLRAALNMFPAEDEI